MKRLFTVNILVLESYFEQPQLGEKFNLEMTYMITACLNEANVKRNAIVKKTKLFCRWYFMKFNIFL